MAELRFAAGKIDEEQFLRMQESGTPDEQVNALLDVSDRVDTKIAALRAHRSQIPEDWFMLTVPEESRPELVGRESFVRVFSRVEVPASETDLFTGLR